MTIKAIETRYKGYLFRSRLEARWAVFFDALGLEWQYEPQGFETDGGDCYLPDFFLPKSKTWVEIKGSDELLQADAKRLENVLDYNSPLPGVRDSCSDECFFNCNEARGLLILGDIPIPRFGLTFHRIVQHSKGLYFEWAFFTPQGPQAMHDRLLEFFRPNPIEPDWTTRSRYVPTHCGWQEVVDAYAAARSARFEHGQSGAV